MIMMHHMSSSEIILNEEYNSFGQLKKNAKSCTQAYIKVYDVLKGTDKTFPYFLKVCGGSPPFTMHVASHNLFFFCTNRIVGYNISYHFSYTAVDPLEVLPLLVDKTFTSFYPYLKVIYIEKPIKFDNETMLNIWHIRSFRGEQIIMKAGINTAGESGIKIMDGPLSVYERFISISDHPNNQDSKRIKDQFNYTATFHVSVICHVKEVVLYPVRLLSFDIIKLPYKAINMPHGLESKRYLNVNSSIKAAYYERWRISTTQPVVIEFREVRKFLGYYDKCAYGGFVIQESLAGSFEDDFSDLTFLYEPICTRFGSEPLVNGINSFQLRENQSSLIVYAYRGFFDIDITVRLRTTGCMGITNLCTICKR